MYRHYTLLSNYSLFSSLSIQTEKKVRNEEQDDIESNLLVPAGVNMRLVTLNLKVYRAEDMPQSTHITEALFNTYDISWSQRENCTKDDKIKTPEITQ